MTKKLIFVLLLFGYGAFFYFITFSGEIRFLKISSGLLSFRNFSYNIWTYTNADEEYDQERRNKVRNITNYNLNTEFRFQMFNDTKKFGKGFDKKWNVYLNETNLLNVPIVDDETVLNSSPVITTGFNSQCYGRAQGLFNSLRKLYNDTKIVYVYDLGLR